MKIIFKRDNAAAGSSNAYEKFSGVTLIFSVKELWFFSTESHEVNRGTVEKLNAQQFKPNNATVGL